MLESHRVPRNIRRNCANLAVVDGIGLVCHKGNPTIKDKPFAFLSEWSTNPCRSCPNYEATSRIFKGTIDIPKVTVQPVERATDSYTIEELEKASKGSAYEFTLEEIEERESIHDELQKPLEQKLIDEKNGFVLPQAVDVQCCDTFFSSPYFLYQDSDRNLYRVSDDSPVLCINGHHLSRDLLVPHQFEVPESGDDPDGYWTQIAAIEKKRSLHTRFPRLCGNATPIENNLHKCNPHNIRLGEAQICQACMFWVLKGEENKAKTS